MRVNNNVKQQDDELLMDVNMTPLIDVMLVLIIMLIISIPVQQNTIDMKNPSLSSSIIPAPQKSIQLKILSDGTVLWNDEMLPDYKMLAARFNQVALNNTDQNIEIKADKNADYKYVIAVLAVAQQQHITSIGIYE